ncbi:MAG TPA: hypothetical protein VHS13_10465 [Edaphobacter sp.]|jgi:hypothetical protein|nr:hypothetical protein [Edaphobacter sp.]
MTGTDIHQALSASAKGLRCTEISPYVEGSWSFNFETNLGLNVQCPWRIVNEHGIALGSEDDDQKFGLPEPIDGSKLAMQLLSESRLKQITVVEETADVTFEFESGTQLQIFNNSMGYEGWSCGSTSGFEVIAMGGGRTANSAPKSFWDSAKE